MKQSAFPIPFMAIHSDEYTEFVGAAVGRRGGYDGEAVATPKNRERVLLSLVEDGRHQSRDCNKEWSMLS